MCYGEPGLKSVLRETEARIRGVGPVTLPAPGRGIAKRMRSGRLWLAALLGLGLVAACVSDPDRYPPEKQVFRFAFLQAPTGTTCEAIGGEGGATQDRTMFGEPRVTVTGAPGNVVIRCSVPGGGVYATNLASQISFAEVRKVDATALYSGRSTALPVDAIIFGERRTYYNAMIRVQ